MVEFKTLLFEIQDNVAHITLNRPEAANTINIELAQELMNATMRCDEDPLIRTVLIGGTGKIFCAGGDLRSFSKQGENLSYYLKKLTTYLHLAVSHLIRMNIPTVAAVHGSAAGAGMSLACACDIVLAAEKARFTMAYTRAGLTPDGGSSYTLTRIVGLKRALELTMSNRVLSAEEALDWGIVTQVVPDKDLAAKSKNLARQIARGPTKAIGAAKRLLLCGLNYDLETQMKYESETIAEMARTGDCREGIASFLERRTPNFKGK
jgi:2-(1,2-epoxy-1,2-dihydrophenyl)acetyl-CoA isomerase